MKVLYAALGIQLVITATSQAVISYSGLRNIPIATTLNGTYLSIQTGMSSNSEFPTWDINAFFGGEAVANSLTFQPVRSSIANESTILNLAPGYVVDASRAYASSMAGSSDHIGTSVLQFSNGVEGYIGFKFTPIVDVDPLFGWMRLQLNNDGNPGLIKDWAIETSGAAISVAVIPEPYSAMFLLSSSVFIFLKRRRQ